MEEAGYQVSHYESRSQASVHQYYYTNCSNFLKRHGARSAPDKAALRGHALRGHR